MGTFIEKLFVAFARTKSGHGVNVRGIDGFGFLLSLNLTASAILINFALKKFSATHLSNDLYCFLIGGIAAVMITLLLSSNKRKLLNKYFNHECYIRYDLYILLYSLASFIIFIVVIYRIKLIF